MTYTTIIQVRQLIDCFYLVVFLWVIEPSRTDRNVTRPIDFHRHDRTVIPDTWDIPDIPRLPEGKTN